MVAASCKAEGGVCQRKDLITDPGWLRRNILTEHERPLERFEYELEDKTDLHRPDLEHIRFAPTCENELQELVERRHRSIGDVCGGLEHEERPIGIISERIGSCDARPVKRPHVERLQPGADEAEILDSPFQFYIPLKSENPPPDV